MWSLPLSQENLHAVEMAYKKDGIPGVYRLVGCDEKWIERLSLHHPYLIRPIMDKGLDGHGGRPPKHYIPALIEAWNTARTSKEAGECVAMLLGHGDRHSACKYMTDLRSDHPDYQIKRWRRPPVITIFGDTERRELHRLWNDAESRSDAVRKCSKYLGVPPEEVPRRISHERKKDKTLSWSLWL